MLFFVSLGFYFLIQAISIQVFRGLAGFSQWAYLQSYSTSPLLVFGYVLAVHLILGGSLGFITRSRSVTSAAANLTRRVPVILRLPFRFFQVSAAAPVLLVCAGLSLRGFCKTSQPKGLQSHGHVSDLFLSTPLQSLQQSFVRSVSNQNDLTSRLPVLAFKLNDLAFPPYSDCLVAPEVALTYVVRRGGSHPLANTLASTITLRTHAVSGLAAGLS